MKQNLIIILFILIFTFGYSQISDAYADKVYKYENAFAENIDSVRTLKANSKLVYSSNNLFKCVHFESISNEIVLVDIKEIEDYSGYIQYLDDSDSLVLFECRERGSGYPIFYMIMDKINGNKEFLETKPRL